ncbi:MAG: 3'-phosphoadenosine 5'-phosphosulfate sulfotransferase, partial [Thermoplasmatota archaeon]
MSIVRLGRMTLSWCHDCGMPVIQGKICPSCGGILKKVYYTPPGDVRPAFMHDTREFRDIADRQWGAGAGDILLPDEGPYLINPCPSIDRLDEVISEG